MTDHIVASILIETFGTVDGPGIRVFKEAKRRWNLHTILDSNGYNGLEKILELLENTDLVLLDLKHINDEKRIELTGKSNERTLKMARWLSDDTCVYKWEALGKAYRLEGVPTPTEAEVARAYELIEKGRTQAQTV